MLDRMSEYIFDVESQSDRMPEYLPEYARDRMPDEALECQDISEQSENMTTDISDEWRIDQKCQTQQQNEDLEFQRMSSANLVKTALRFRRSDFETLLPRGQVGP